MTGSAAEAGGSGTVRTLLCYGAVFLCGLISALRGSSTLPMDVVLRDLFFWPVFINEGEFWLFAGLLGLALALSLAWRRSWLGTALGCLAIVGWIVMGMGLSGLRIT